MAQVLADKPVDLIILDLKLSGEDGLALMRARGSLEIPVIAVTGHRRDEADRATGRITIHATRKPKAARERRAVVIRDI
jgi:DNA-binding response OmpR family regulator